MPKAEDQVFNIWALRGYSRSKLKHGRRVYTRYCGSHRRKKENQRSFPEKRIYRNYQRIRQRTTSIAFFLFCFK
jgi:IS5 family transposase